MNHPDSNKPDMTIVVNGHEIKIPWWSGTYQDILKASSPTSMSSLYGKILK